MISIEYHGLCALYYSFLYLSGIDLYIMPVLFSEAKDAQGNIVTIANASKGVKYTCIYCVQTVFQKGNGSAYGKARQKGWIKDYTWFTVKQHAPYTREQCFAVAKKYKSRNELALSNGSSYDVARRKGWLSDYTWFEEKQKPSGYWHNYDNCYKAAKGCKTITEFIKMHNPAYVWANKQGWLKDYNWFVKKLNEHLIFARNRQSPQKRKMISQ